MSSRALRRLQREEEERKQLEAIQNEQDEDEEEEDDDDFKPALNLKPQNAFDFLNAAENEDEGNESDEGDHRNGKPEAGGAISPEITPSSSNKTKKKAKKKKKKSGKAAAATTAEVKTDSEIDEIDQALNALKTDKPSASADGQYADPALRSFYEILSTDSKHLNPLNEMKKLFGSAVLEGTREDTGNRRRGRGPTHLDLGAALTGRHSQASRGQGLAGLALRRNVLMLGKEEWPKAASGGLGMELVEEASDFTIEYKFVHSAMYQTTQRQFDLCVESMDPQRMISHLQLNPYHISTLLQVSEIAKQQGDHAVAVDLLERALFTFGRSVHSTFANAMANGRARLDFRRPENREFWLAAYRYIGTLGQRGTWRTAFEWAKLLLSLDPEQDPYSVRLIMDQMALRGAQFDTLIKLAETPIDLIDWGQSSPNVRISLAMAYYKVKRLSDAQETLRSAIAQYPWVLANLCKELAMEPIPKAVWGRTPRTGREELYTVSYGLNAKDIWNTPEALSFLKSVVESAPRDEPPNAPTDPEEKNLSLAECRHIVLSETPALMSILPREVSNFRTTASDPLPPPDDLQTYNITNAEPTREEWEEELEANQREAAGLQSWFGGILSRLGLNFGSTANEQDPALVEQVTAALEASDMDMGEIAFRTSRMEELRHRQATAERRLEELQADLHNVDDRNAAARMQQLQDIANEDSELIAALNASMEDHNASQATAASPPVVERAPLQASVEDDPDEIPQPTSSSNSEPQPLLQDAATGGYDDNANQRWLAGRGMLRLKDFIAQHGSDETAWKDDLEIDITPATEYAHRITLLKNRSSKEFILNYALKQGAGAPASDLIRRLLS